MTVTSDANDLLSRSSAPAFKFENIGDGFDGKVVSAEKRQQTDYGTGEPKFYDNGDPMWEVVITLDTGVEDSNGETEKRLFARGALLRAVREALKEAGAKLETGGHLRGKYTADGEPPKKGFHPPKLFKAKYTPPAPAAVDLDDL